MNVQPGVLEEELLVVLVVHVYLNLAYSHLDPFISSHQKYVFSKYIQTILSGNYCEKFVHSNLVDTYGTHLTQIQLLLLSY